MRIASATLQMESNHTSQQHHEVSDALRSWIGNGPASTTRPLATQSLSAPLVQISDAGKNAQSGETNAIEQGINAAENSPMLSLIRALVAMLTGHDVKLVDTSALGSAARAVTPHAESSPPQQVPQQRSGLGIEYSHHESYSESEQTRLAASGVVRTTDGRSIDFSLSLSMTRSYREESNVSIRLGDARKTQDPLVVNFDGTAVQLTSQRFKFDLNSDGQSENINFVAGGSGFLALDRNGDGQINNGTELFGAKSGNGFAELATLDDDHNGWIDENDAAYAQLRVWTKEPGGQDRLSTLKEADVGAISLAHVATPFDLKNAKNELQGQIRSSGIFLHEQGNVGTIQQVDLTV